MIKDWFHKEPFPLDLLEELKEQVLAMTEGVKWEPCHPSQAPGSAWYLVKLPEALHAKIDAAVGFKTYPDFYIWNYFDIKELNVHKDNNERGSGRNIAGVIPLIGDFETHAYLDGDLTTPVDKLQYGPGTILFLNNTKYFHGGRVLSPTRLSMHFYFDFYNRDGDTMDAVLTKNRRA